MYFKELETEKMKLDITKEPRWFLKRKIDKLVRQSERIQDKLVITMEQYEYLHKDIEVFGGNDKIDAEFLYHGKYNIMELEIK